MKRTYCFFFLLLWAFSVSAQGLQFESKHMPNQDRPSLQIFKPGREPHYRESFSISFDLSIYSFDSFGYIFMIYDKVTSLSYSFTYTYLDEENGIFKFNTDGKQNHYTMNFRNSDLAYQWIPVRLDFDLIRKSVQVEIAGKKQEVAVPTLEDSFRPLIYFGKHDYILDVPKIAIRDLCLSGKGGGEYCFPLNESDGEKVHTSEGQVLGCTFNSRWMINDSYQWKKLLEYDSKTPMGATFNEKTQQLLIFNQDSLFTFHMPSRKFSSRPYANSLPVSLQLGTHYLDTENGKLVVYELNNLPLGDVTTAGLEIETARWDIIGTASLPVQFHHHVGYWNAVEKKYCIFGGFGNKRYNNTFLAYSPLTDSWDTLAFSGDRIAPRYFSGLAHSRDHRFFYIYGGMGNDSGEQSLGRNYFHDLYRIDSQERSVRKLWDSGSENRTVVGRNMVLSDDGKKIYAIVYPEYLNDTEIRLKEMDIKTGEERLLGNLIPMRSDQIMNNANLYYNQWMHEFYVTTIAFDPDGSSHCSVYSLLAPPISCDQLVAYKKAETAQAWRSVRSALVLALILALIAVPFLIFLKRHLRMDVSVEQLPQSPESVPEPAVVENDSTGTVSERPDSVYLFGPFTVIDRTGYDITHLFSPRLRLVFVYILLHSHHEGVLSGALNELFWPDKSDDKVKNLKGVTISQIRKILLQLDGMELIYSKGYFKIICNEPCYCDYLDFYQHENDGKEQHDLTHLLLRGKFLEGFSSEIFDNRRQKVDEFMISYLTLEMQRVYRLHQYDMVSRICSLIFRIDPINEQALLYYVHILMVMNQSQEAIRHYSKFVRDYKHLMNEDYPKTFSELLDESLR